MSPLLISLTHRPHSSSFLGLPYRVLNMNPKKELLWGLWVMPHRLDPYCNRVWSYITDLVLAESMWGSLGILVGSLVSGPLSCSHNKTVFNCADLCYNLSEPWKKSPKPLNPQRGSACCVEGRLPKPQTATSVVWNETSLRIALFRIRLPVHRAQTPHPTNRHGESSHPESSFSKP